MLTECVAGPSHEYVARNIAGQVYDPAGDPVTGASVVLQRVGQAEAKALRTKTSRDGYFNLGMLAAGRYWLTARIAGYLATEVLVTVFPRAPARMVAIQLEADTGLSCPGSACSAVGHRRFRKPPECISVGSVGIEQ